MPTIGAVDSSDLIDKLGGTAAVARRVRTSPASVSEWRRNGIPDGRFIELGAAIERATKGAVRRWDLRPDDWWLIWPELIGADGAPALPLPAPAPAHPEPIPQGA